MFKFFAQVLMFVNVNGLMFPTLQCFLSDVILVKNVTVHYFSH